MSESKSVAKSKNRKVISIKMDATFFFERAVQSLDRYHYDKALKYFRRAVEYEPENPVNHCNMAGILSELGDYEESNEILRKVIDEIDPNMTECYFYMANNFANMEEYEAAESALVTYLETDPDGQYLEESEEMMELLSYELERPTKLKNIKSRENLFAHDRARLLLEEGRFSDAMKVLEALIGKNPDFLAARNNLALAYYYQGDIDKAIAIVDAVLEHDVGNLHALCNKAIFLSHMGKHRRLTELLELLARMEPFHHEHVFKLATTLGILGDHASAYRHFKRLMKTDEAAYDPSLYHYTAVAAFNIRKPDEAVRLWKQLQKLDPDSQVAAFYLDHIGRRQDGDCPVKLNYYYHLPYEEQFRISEKSPGKLMEQLKMDSLARSSYFWALLHGDYDAKLQVIQTLGALKDAEVEAALRRFIREPSEPDDLKQIAVFALRNMGVKESIPAVLQGKETQIALKPLSANLPVWEEEWQQIVETALRGMDQHYDMIQKHDLQTLWVEFLSRVYPSVPKFVKKEGWAAALEYLTAKMHSRSISYRELSDKYRVSPATVRKYVGVIDRTCGLREKMQAIFAGYHKIR